MRKVFVEPVVLPEPRFRDGLGIRYVRTDGTDDPVEVLRPLWDVGAMQNAIRQRVGRLASFRQARFVPVRAAEVPRDDASTIEVVSDYVPGYRLSQYLDASKAGALSIQPSTAIHLLRELLGALALLHESRGVTHGAIGPERILITPKGRAVVADYVLGPAIERLEFSRTRLWREFRVPLPAGKGLPKLDDLADVVQVGATALALLAGRPIEMAEYPGGLDDLLAAVAQPRGSDGRPAVPAALVGWVKRALLKDPNGRFANVRDARLALEAVLSKQNAATGGAAALKSMAELFGRYAAALEAEAAAAAAEEARKAALAAQAAAAVTTPDEPDADAAAPAVDSVPAFTLLSDSPAGLFEGALQDGALEPVPAAGADSDPPVGWRVPEPAPIEDTLPTSPLIQLDEPAGSTPADEFVEEVLDLTSLASSDEADLVAADAVITTEAVGAQVGLEETQAPVAATADGIVDVVVDLRELNTAEVAAEDVKAVPAAVESAPASLELVATEAVATAPEVAPPEGPIEAAAAVDAALAALAALEAAAPAARPDALPEWRLLADPVGANAPTIDVEEPKESLEELVAQFAAMEGIKEPPALVAGMPVPEVDEPSIQMEPPAIVTEPAVAMVAAPIPVMEPPVTMVEARVPLMEAPAEFPVPAADQPADDVASAAAIPSVLDEIVSLQEAQAAAQAGVESTAAAPAPEPDIAAWSFVGELLHHDTRFAARQAADDASALPVADEVPLPSPAIEAQPTPAALAAAPDEMQPAALAEEAAVGAAPTADQPVTALPADWFIEVGLRPGPQAPVFVSRNEPEEIPYAPAAGQPAEDVASAVAIPSVSDEIVSLREAQAAAQAGVESTAAAPAPEPDIAAWSFVEELLHHDTRFAARQAADDASARPVADEVALPSPATETEPAPAGLAEEAAVGAAPAADQPGPALPADWFIEVRPRPVPQAPVFVSRSEPEEIPYVPAAQLEAPAPRAAPDQEAAPSLPPVAWRAELPAPDEDPGGPVFPRVAPSIRRIRSEARRRRLARIRSSVGGGIQAVLSACASGVGAVAGGAVHVFSSAGRGAVALGLAGLTAVRVSATAVSRGIGATIRAAATGTAAIVNGVARAGGKAARATGTAVGSALVGTGRGLLAVSSALAAAASVAVKAAVAIVRAGGRALAAAAGVASRAAVAIGRAGGRALAAAARGMAAGLRALGRAGLTGAAAGLRGVGLAGRAAGRAAASVAAVAGGLAARGTASTGKGLGRTAFTVSRKVYFAASDIADRLPKPVFRPWYLAAALLVIVAVAGVPYAKARFFTAKQEVGLIRVESTRPGALVTIDGVPHGRTPLTATVPAGRHSIEVSIAGRTRAHDVEVYTDRETLVQAAGSDLKVTGSIRVTTDPDGAEVLVDGVLQGTAPLTIGGVAEGPHVVLVRDRSGSVQQIVRVGADESADATIRIRPGWLAVFAPVRLDILENGRSVGSTERGRILTPPGPHTIELVSQAVGFRETRQVDIKPGEVTAVTIAMPPVKIEVVAPAEAEILVDGQSVGTAPVGALRVAVGTREILMRHPTLGERRQVVSVTYNVPVRIVFE